MKVIHIGRGCETMVDDEDYDFLSQFKWRPQGLHKKNVTSYAGYYVREEGKIKIVFLHRVLMKAKSGQFVDHIDHNGLNNQKSNLRFCTKSENQMNRRKGVGKTSPYLGVFWHNGNRSWRATVVKNGKLMFSAYFKSPVDAAKARDLRASKIHGEFASLNFPNA